MNGLNAPTFTPGLSSRTASVAFFLIGIFLSLFFCVAGGQTAKAESRWIRARGLKVAKSLNHENVSRDYFVHLPSGYDKTKKHPLIVLLHGGGGIAEKEPLDPALVRSGVIGVLPQGMDTHWNDGRMELFEGKNGTKRAYDDVGFIDKLIDQMILDYNADPMRIYVCGMSNGGFMTQRIAMELSHRVAAFGVVTANLSYFLAEMKPELPTPIIFINGTRDKIVPYNGGKVFKRSSPIHSTDETVEYYIKHNECSAAPVVTAMPDRNKQDGTTSVKMVYASETSGAKVVLIRVDGGGHTWPGRRWGMLNLLVGRTSRDFSATEEILNFCKQYKRSPRSVGNSRARSSPLPIREAPGKR